MAQQDGQENTGTQVFDLAKAVEMARRDFPAQTKNITFIDTTAPDAEDQLYAWAVKAGQNQIQYETLLDYKDQHITVARESNGHRLIALPLGREAEDGAFPGNPYKSAWYSFLHELGHFVVPEAHASTGSKSTQHNEHAADTFAAVMGLQLGIFDKADIAALADGRSHGMLLTKDVTHLTSMSLDAIVINPKNIDFMSLSKAEVVAIAKKHAATFEMEEGIGSKFANLQGMHRWAEKEGIPLADIVSEKLVKIHEIAMTAPAQSQDFYLAARILDTALETGIMKYGSQQAEVDVTATEWKDMRSKLQSKWLSEHPERDIGGKKALESPELHRKDEVPKTLIGRIKNSVTPLKI